MDFTKWNARRRRAPEWSSRQMEAIITTLEKSTAPWRQNTNGKNMVGVVNWTETLSCLVCGCNVRVQHFVHMESPSQSHSLSLVFTKFDRTDLQREMDNGQQPWNWNHSGRSDCQRTETLIRHQLRTTHWVTRIHFWSPDLCVHQSNSQIFRANYVEVGILSKLATTVSIDRTNWSKKLWKRCRFRGSSRGICSGLNSVFRRM